MIRRLHRSQLPFSTFIVALAVFVTAGPLHADECEAVDTDGLPRDCTFLEEYGECLYEAKESTEQCKEAAEDSWWKEELCDIGAAIDIVACSIELPLELIGEALD